MTPEIPNFRNQITEMQIVRAIISDHRAESAGDQHADPVARVRTQHGGGALVGLPTPQPLPTQGNGCSEQRRQRGDHPDPGQFHVAAQEIRGIGRRGSDDDDRGPIINLMNGSIEPLARDHDRERHCKERESVDVAEPQIVGEKIPHVRAKNAGEAERGPVPRSQRRKVDWLHGRHFLARCLIAIGTAFRFS